VRALSLVASLVCIATPALSSAKPKPQIAVAPLQGDADHSVAEAIVDALDGKDFTVVGPKDVHREATKLGLADELDAKDARRLLHKLDVAAMIEGKVAARGRTRTLRLTLHPRGKPDIHATVEFKSSSAPAFRRRIHDWVRKQVDGNPAAEPDEQDDVSRRKASDDGADTDSRRTRVADDDEADRKRKASADDDRRTRVADDDEADRKRKAPDDAAVARRTSDDGDRRAGKASDDTSAARRKRVADDDAPSVRKRQSRRNGSDEPSAARDAWIAAGASVAQRQLTYDTRSDFVQVPPRVKTTAGAGRIAGEVYPFALTGSQGSLAALGVAATYDKTVGLSIKIPSQSARAPINQSHYAIGARYRFGVGESSTIAVGIDYARRHYIADRASLTAMAVVLDTPDVDYSAIAPGIAMQVPVTRSVAIVGGLDALLMLDAGPVQTADSYGPAKVYGIEAAGGANVAIAKKIALRVALEYSRISFSFSGKGAMSINRDNNPATQDINGAIDRALGVSATLGLVY
jgi:hypothetical protein